MSPLAPTTQMSFGPLPEMSYSAFWVTWLICTVLHWFETRAPHTPLRPHEAPHTTVRCLPHVSAFVSVPHEVPQN
jgi:hypothetical protein